MRGARAGLTRCCAQPESGTTYEGASGLSNSKYRAQMKTPPGGGVQNPL